MASSPDNSTLCQLISDRTPAVDPASFSLGEWASLLRAAQREGVGPLLYWRLSKSGKLASVPAAVRDSLRAIYARTWAQNQKILNELGTLARLFHEARIPVVVLKGACFALTIYPDIGLRPMGDLDVLVTASMLSAAVQLAKSLGYEDSLPEASPGLRDLLNHEVCLHKPAQSFPLEIHKSLVADRSFAYAVSVDWFWEQTEPLAASPTRPGLEHLLLLTPAAQLLYAASHAMLQHGGHNTPLRWYCDLDLLVRASGGRLDWDLLLAQSQKFEWSSALQAALSQTQSYFDTPVPDEVLFALSRQRDRLESLVIMKQTQPATHILAERQKLLSLDWYGRARLVLALLFPSPAYMRWRYKLQNLWTLPLWYLVRWGGILKDGVHTVISLAQGRAQAG